MADIASVLKPGFMYDEDDPGGAAGEEDGDDDGKTFTQKELNAILANHKRQLRSELEKLAREKEDLEEILIEAAGGREAVDYATEYYTEHGELPPGMVDEEDDEDEQGAESERVRGNYFVQGEDGEMIPIEGAENFEALLKGVTKRYDRRLKALEDTLTRERDRAQDLEKKSMEKERDQLLIEALSKNDCIDIKAGLKLYRDQMVWDNEEEAWRFKTKDDIYVEPHVGLAEEMHDWLRRPMGGNGGSGARGTTRAQAESLLQKKEGDLKALQEKARKSGDQRDVDAYQRLNREVQQLKQSTMTPTDRSSTTELSTRMRQPVSPSNMTNPNRQ